MKLTKRERELLPLLFLPTQKISKRLCISNGTTRTHIANILFKFPEQENRYSVVLEAIKQGLITIDEVVTK